jgi:hypothetical protein
MKPVFLSSGIFAACVLVPLSAHAIVTATSLSSFEGIEEPLVRYAPATKTFVRDELINITDVGDRTFRMRLRYHPEGWDADRDTPNKDRQRAEVKGLGPHQKLGETFEYATTWRTNPSFKGAGRFCHIFQLKSTDGDSGAPLLTISIQEGSSRATIEYWVGPAKSSTTVREFVWAPGEWHAVRMRIKTSLTADGEVLASINGDEFQGVRGVPVYRTDATEFRPKWGLYRNAAPGLPLGDDYVEHRNVSAGKVGSSSDEDPAELETAARAMAKESPLKPLEWLQSQPASPSRALALATSLAHWAETQPAEAMAWTEKLSPAEGRADALMRVFNRWADQDIDAVLRWLSTRAPREELDQPLWYFATDSTFRYVQRPKALAGAALIADPDMRMRAFEHILLIWARTEPQQAATYLNGVAVLNPAQKEFILKKIPGRREEAGASAKTPVK